MLDVIRENVQVRPDILRVIQDILIYQYYPMLGLLLTLILVSIFLSRKQLKQELSLLSARSLLVVFVIMLFSAIIRFFVLSHHPQVFFDEVTFIETADNFHTKALNLQNCYGPGRNEFLICTTGWPFLISLVFKLTGVNIRAAFFLSALLSTLTVFLVFWAGTLVFKREEAGLWSALIFSLYPVILRLSTSSAMGTSSMFFIFLTLISFIIYFRQRSNPLLYLSFSLLGYAINIRQEALLTILPLLLIFFFMNVPMRKKLFRNGHFHLCMLILILASVLPALVTFMGVSTGFYYFYEPPEMMSQHISHNLQNNLVYWIANRIQPLSVTIISILGLLVLYGKDRRLAIFMAFWFLSLQVFYSVNPSCDFSAIITLDSWRNSIHMLVPLILLSGAGMVAMTDFIMEKQKKLYYPVMILLLISVIFIPFRFWRFIEKKTIYARENLFIQSLPGSIPKDSVFVIDGGYPSHIFESFVPMFEYSSSFDGRYYHTTELNPVSMRRIVADYEKWRAENRPVYLFLSFVRDDYLRAKLYPYFNTFETEPVRGFGSLQNGRGFMIYRITALKNQEDR